LSSVVISLLQTDCPHESSKGRKMITGDVRFWRWRVRVESESSSQIKS